MRSRITDWPTTVLGIFILLFLGWVVEKVPALVERPETFIALAVGVAGLFLKGRKNAE